MNPNRSSQTVQPGRIGRPSSPAIPEWMQAAGFAHYTQYSNGVLEAHMAPGRPLTERIVAFLARFSWGLQSDFVRWGNRPARNVDIARKLNLDEANVSRAIQSLVKRDWLVVDSEGLMFLQAHPPLEIAPAEAEEEAEDATLPDRATIKAQRFPQFVQRKEKCLKEWADLRKLERQIDHYCDNKIAEIRALKVVCTNNFSDEKPVPTTSVAVHAVKGCQNQQLEEGRILISLKELKRTKLASCENPAAAGSEQKGRRGQDRQAETPSSEETASELTELIARMQETTGLGSYLASPTAGNIASLLRHGTPEEIIGFLADRFRVKREPWKEWGGAIHAVRHDIEQWRARNAALLAPASPAAPVRDDEWSEDPEPTTKELIEKFERALDSSDLDASARKMIVTQLTSLRAELAKGATI